MRTVSEIVGAVQDQQPATEEELRLALLCLYYLGTLHSHYPGDDDDVPSRIYKMRARDESEARLRLLEAAPDEYLGERWTPGTKANADGRRVSEAFWREVERRLATKPDQQESQESEPA